MAGDLPIWIDRFADMLGCDSRPASVAVTIEDLLAERERQLKTIGRLRGMNAVLLRREESIVGRPAADVRASTSQTHRYAFSGPRT